MGVTIGPLHCCCTPCQRASGGFCPTCGSPVSSRCYARRSGAIRSREGRMGIGAAILGSPRPESREALPGSASDSPRQRSRHIGSRRGTIQA